jgi:hypothetical protein
MLEVVQSERQNWNQIKQEMKMDIYKKNCSKWNKAAIKSVKNSAMQLSSDRKLSVP